MFFDAGGGHRAAAMALRSVCEFQQRPWKIRLVNLQEVLDPLDIVRRLCGIRLQDLYNTLLAKGWTYGAPQLLRAMQAMIRMYYRPGVRVLEAHWRATRPEMVVSVVPNFNRVAYEGLRRAVPRAPYVTVLTDLVDYPPHFWMEPQEQYVICGTDRAVEQARAMGHSRERVFRVSGMILQPGFYEPIRVDRSAEREQLGLHACLPTGLVLFGGQGSGVMYEIAERLNASTLDVQLILLCGHNRELGARLRSCKWRLPIVVEGFTSKVPYYMHLSDFFVGKPGPGSLSEALHMRLPVIVACNAATLPHERFNADWVVHNHYGMVVRKFREIASAVQQLLEPDFYARCRASAAALENRAVFEIPDILEGILAAHVG